MIFRLTRRHSFLRSIVSKDLDLLRLYYPRKFRYPPVITNRYRKCPLGVEFTLFSQYVHLSAWQLILTVKRTWPLVTLGLQGNIKGYFYKVQSRCLYSKGFTSASLLHSVNLFAVITIQQPRKKETYVTARISTMAVFLACFLQCCPYTLFLRSTSCSRAPYASCFSRCMKLIAHNPLLSREQNILVYFLAWYLLTASRCFIHPLCSRIGTQLLRHGTQTEV